MKPKRKGDVDRNDEGVSLVNDAGNAFPVNETTVVIWEKCNGKNEVGDITAAFLKAMEIGEEHKDEVHIAIDSTIKELEKAQLVQHG